MANIITTLALEMSANWYVSKKLSSVGRVGENTVTKLTIEVAEILDDVTYELEIMSADGSKNVAELTVDGTELYLILTANMLTTSGITKMQVRAVFEDNSIKKSNIFELKVNRSISATDYYEEYSVTIFDQLVAECQDIIDGAEGYVERAETAAVNAEAYEQSASASATAASNSADNAAASETNASNSANAASTSAGNAHTYELNAKGYSENAASSAGAASTSETNAHDYELSAKGYSEAASTSAGNAGASATNAYNSEQSAKGYAQAASTSEGNASTYATNAYNSAQNAATSETNAHTSEVNAGNSETNASNSATAAHTSETNAANSATAAGNSETAAGNSASAAATSATNAHNSEVAAGNSETNASASATEAAEAAETVASSVAQINENTWRINDLEAIIGGYTLTDLPTGTMASITNGTALLMPSLKIGIEPVQAGSGDPSPENIRPISGWTAANVTRSGKNIALPINNVTFADVSTSTDSSGKTTVSGTASGNGGRLILCSNAITLKAGTYTISHNGTGTWGEHIDITNNSTKVLILSCGPDETYKSFTLLEQTNILIGITVRNGTTYSGTLQPQLELGTTATSYEPYSRQTYNVQFTDGTNPLTVYGGNLNAISGLLTVTDAYIASYNGETLPSTWISDRDAYAAGTTPTTGAQVVYTLENSVTYQLTPTQIRTLVGNNNIWADTGDIIEGKYYGSPS